MKTLLTLTQQDIAPDNQPLDTGEFRTREAARAVVLGSDNSIYLLNVTKQSYHKLPGGGLEGDESPEEALARELLEEIGCCAEMIAELGKVVEYRDYDDGGIVQTSYCYLVRQTGIQVNSNLDEHELAKGMHEVKVASIDDAIAMLSEDVPKDTEGKFIQKRDIVILQAAKEALVQNKKTGAYRES